jgi:hypothetical protein
VRNSASFSALVHLLLVTLLGAIIKFFFLITILNDIFDILDLLNHSSDSMCELAILPEVDIRVKSFVSRQPSTIRDGKCPALLVRPVKRRGFIAGHLEIFDVTVAQPGKVRLNQSGIIVRNVQCFGREVDVEASKLFQ